MILHVVEAYTDTFRERCHEVDWVCVGDSITGWNNFGPPRTWPFPTYPMFLAERLTESERHVGNAGIAGEVSANGLRHTRSSLRWFPNARTVVIGFGTNDLGTLPDTESTSRRILDNLAAMLDAVRDEGRRPVLLNVPPINEAAFPERMVLEAREKRSYHNQALDGFSTAQGVPLIDIHSPLNDEHFGDELHPNAEGARCVADRVFARLADYR